ncbi:MAG: hypothetical protein IT350_09970 [Deltaproteobacteria bacterium]|nr:hypothetical protein [Deltaproteobacteria bacterium]
MRARGIYVFVLIVGVATFASGDDVTGVVFHDADHSARSHYVLHRNATDVVLPGVDVALIDAVGEVAAQTDADGAFVFEGVADGFYLLDTQDGGHDATSSNVARRVPEAIREGELVMVSLGDSIGATGTPYPSRLADLLGELTTVDLHNIHVGGSKSWDWLPGGGGDGHYEDLLEPLLEDADLFTITLTGNDMEAYIDGLTPPYDVWEVLGRVIDHPEYVLESYPRLLDLIDAIRTANPGADIVYAIYPNFANSTFIYDRIGPDLQPLAAVIVDLYMGIGRVVVAGETDALLADMDAFYGDAWLDDYLIDEVHPSEAGSQDYAEQMFIALGGVRVGDEPLGLDREIGLYAPDLAPADDDTDDDSDDDMDDDTTDDDASDDDDATDDDTVDDDVSDDDSLDDDTMDDDSDDDQTDDDSADDDASNDDDATGQGGGDDDDDACGC